MYTLRVKSHFDAAHFIKDYPGKCSRMHGHRWEVEVTIRGGKLDTMNMLADFSDVKKTLSGLLKGLDHYVLNTQLNEDRVTAEFLAEWMYTYLSPYLAELSVVTVWESPECSVGYSKGGVVC